MSRTSPKERTARPSRLSRAPSSPFWTAPALWLSIGLILITVIVFAPIRTYGFVPWDDPLYVTQNPHVLAGLTARGVVWALTTGEQFYWHPLTWLTHMLDVQVYGLTAGGHHVTNLLLHLMSMLLLFGALQRMTGSIGRSAFVAALFAIHPLHVESVAWVAERKDVLSGFFFMLTIWTYVSYARMPGVRRYLLVLLCFVLALMSKPMVVTLPFVLLLLDVWPLGRLRRVRIRDQGSGNEPSGVTWRALVREKLPLIALGVAASAMTFVNQLRAGSMRTLGGFPFGLRLANAVVSYVTYIVDMVWPAGLAAYYPYPTSPPASWIVLSALLGIVLASVFVTWAAGRRPYLAVGWFWYLGTLLPVIGLIQVGTQARADRFTYIPLIGLFVMAAWGIPDLLARGRRARNALVAAGLIVILAFATVARAQVRYWKDGFSLWERAAAVTTGNQQAYASLGQLLEEQGRADGAIAKYREACRFMQEASGLHTRIGTLLMQQGKAGEANAEFLLALKTQPNNAVAHYNVALALDAQGKASEALEQYRVAVRCQPESAVAHHGLGTALDRQGRTSEGIDELAEAVRIRPDWTLARNSLALALARQGRLDEAIREALEVVRLEPSNAEWHSNLSVIFSQRGDTKEAIEQLELALGLNPQHPEAAMWHYNLAAMFDRLGDKARVVEHLQAALQLNPQYEPARRALANLTATPR
jgi:tetratricopeptide (TPR) repeat protein